IETAETVDTVRMRKESLAAIEELKLKGPNSRREMTSWGQVGQGALSMSCVVAAATGQFELGIPCVIGGPADPPGLQYMSKWMEHGGGSPGADATLRPKPWLDWRCWRGSSERRRRFVLCAERAVHRQ